MLEFYGPVNNEVMSSRSLNSGTVPVQANCLIKLNIAGGLGLGVGRSAVSSH